MSDVDTPKNIVVYGRDERIFRLQEIVDKARYVDMDSPIAYKYVNAAIDATKELNKMLGDGAPPHEYRKQSSNKEFFRSKKLGLAGKPLDQQLSILIDAIDDGELSVKEAEMFGAMLQAGLKAQEQLELKPMLQQALDKLNQREESI